MTKKASVRLEAPISPTITGMVLGKGENGIFCLHFSIQIPEAVSETDWTESGDRGFMVDHSSICHHLDTEASTKHRVLQADRFPSSCFHRSVACVKHAVHYVSFSKGFARLLSLLNTRYEVLQFE